MLGFEGTARRSPRKQIVLEEAAHHVHPRVRDAGPPVHEECTRLRMPHVLIGGLVVGAHGDSRATSDARFRTGEEGFLSHGRLVSMLPGGPFDECGVEVGYLGPDGPFFEPNVECARGATVRLVVPVEGLVALKLLARRPRDENDLRVRVNAGRDGRATREHVQRVLPDSIDLFDTVVDEAEDDR